MKKKKFDYLRHLQTGKEVKIKNGFSWTVALFGPIALAIRGEWIPFGISIGLVVLLAALDLNIPSGASTGVWIAYGSVGNELLLKKRLRQGYEIIT